MLKGSIVIAATLAVCGAALGLPRFGVALYPTALHSDMRQPTFPGATDTCDTPRFMSGPPAYDQTNNGGSIYGRMASFSTGSYMESVHCQCFNGSSPAADGYDSYRSKLPGQLKAERDSFRQTALGSRYEVEGTFSNLRLYSAIDGGAKCSIVSTVTWSSPDAERARRFIEANGVDR